jgi:hypothetical protein
MRTGQCRAKRTGRARLLADTIAARCRKATRKSSTQMRATVDEKLNETLATRLGGIVHGGL